VHAGQPFRGRPQGGPQQGLVRDDISAPALMLAIQAIGRMWVTAPRSVTSAADPDEDDDVRRRRRTGPRRTRRAVKIFRKSSPQVRPRWVPPAV
jgi:hypothetical protein